jgi:hypothetical protein
MTNKELQNAIDSLLDYLTKCRNDVKVKRQLEELLKVQVKRASE